MNGRATSAPDAVSNGAKPPRHIMSIDLECWHDLILRNAGYAPEIDSRSLLRQTESILEVLSDSNTKCTFFVLANVAEKHPELVQHLVAEGHEIGIHGTAHKPLYLHDRRSLLNDLNYCKKLVEDVAGVAVQSHRAPIFSILKDNLWALDVIAEIGITTDSSIFPMRLPRYGIADFPRRAHSIRTPGGETVFEVPLSIVDFAGRSWPISGGGYARIAPGWLLDKAVQKLEAEDLPLVLYFHPYEFDPKPLVAPKSLRGAKGAVLSLKWNFNRNTIREKVRSLLNQFRFGTMKQYVATYRT